MMQSELKVKSALNVMIQNINPAQGQDETSEEEAGQKRHVPISTKTIDLSLLNMVRNMYQAFHASKQPIADDFAEALAMGSKKYRMAIGELYRYLYDKDFDHHMRLAFISSYPDFYRLSNSLGKPLRDHRAKCFHACKRFIMFNRSSYNRVLADIISTCSDKGVHRLRKAYERRYGKDLLTSLPAILSAANRPAFELLLVGNRNSKKNMEKATEANSVASKVLSMVDNFQLNQVNLIKELCVLSDAELRKLNKEFKSLRNEGPDLIERLRNVKKKNLNSKLLSNLVANACDPVQLAVKQLRNILTALMGVDWLRLINLAVTHSPRRWAEINSRFNNQLSGQTIKGRKIKSLRELIYSRTKDPFRKLFLASIGLYDGEITHTGKGTQGEANRADEDGAYESAAANDADNVYENADAVNENPYEYIGDGAEGEDEG